MFPLTLVRLGWMQEHPDDTFAQNVPRLYIPYAIYKYLYSHFDVNNYFLKYTSSILYKKKTVSSNAKHSVEYYCKVIP